MVSSFPLESGVSAVVESGVSAVVSEFGSHPRGGEFGSCPVLAFVLYAGVVAGACNPAARGVDSKPLSHKVRGQRGNWAHTAIAHPRQCGVTPPPKRGASTG